MQEMWAHSLGGEVPLKEEIATHSSISYLVDPRDRGVWREQSMGLQRVGHDLAIKQNNNSWVQSYLCMQICSQYMYIYIHTHTHTHTHTHIQTHQDCPSGSVAKNLPQCKWWQEVWFWSWHWEGNGNLLEYSCLGKPMDRGAWGTIVHEVVI